MIGFLWSLYLHGYYFSSAHSPRLLPPAPFTFLRPPAKITFSRPPRIKMTFLQPELSKLLFHGPVGREYFLYFCIVKVSDFSIVYIASAKIPEREGSISPSNFYGQLPGYWSHVLSLNYPVDGCSFKEVKTWGQPEISFYPVVVLRYGYNKAMVIQFIFLIYLPTYFVE